MQIGGRAMESDAQLCLPLVMRRKAVCRRTGMTLTMLRRAMEKDAFLAQ